MDDEMRDDEVNDPTFDDMSPKKKGRDDEDVSGENTDGDVDGEEEDYEDGDDDEEEDEDM